MKALSSYTSVSSSQNQLDLKGLALETHQEYLYSQSDVQLGRLRPLDQESKAFHNYYSLQDGKQSDIHQAFTLQIAKESICGSCPQLKRWIEHNCRIDLTPGTETEDTSITRMLDTFFRNAYDFVSPIKQRSNCAAQGHSGGLRAWTRLTILPSYLMLCIIRGNDSPQNPEFLNHVDIPEFLDMVSTKDNAFGIVG